MIYTMFFLILFCIATLCAIFYRARWQYSEKLMRNYYAAKKELTMRFTRSTGQAEYYKKKYNQLLKKFHEI
jgi:hypothetical protein